MFLTDNIFGIFPSLLQLLTISLPHLRPCPTKPSLQLLMLQRLCRSPMRTLQCCSA